MDITFYGAAGEVTGSKHLVKLNGKCVLLDCGLFQGRRKETQERNAEFPIDAATVDAVVISHAHLDHIGALPLLVQSGYRGKIYSTGATRDLAELILLDTAKIQTQDAEYMNRHQYPEAPLHEPLYRAEDIPAVMERFVHVSYTFLDPAWTEIAPGVELRLYDAGHILGSAVVQIRSMENHAESVVYTGDLGRQNAPLLRNPDLVTEPAAAMIMESTYGDRLHHPVADVNQKLVDIINGVATSGGKIVVPAFSLGRTQELVYLLHKLTDDNRIPRIPIYVDSPLARRITEVFFHHQRDYNPQTMVDFHLPGENPLVFTNLRYVETVDESKALNTAPGPCMIISASGMVTAGRVIHHLNNTIEDPKNVVLMTGFQAEHTLGRKLMSGAASIDIYGRDVPVRAQVIALNDLSAHADGDELAAYARAVPGLYELFLVHGEADQAKALKTRLTMEHPTWQIEIPERGSNFTVSSPPVPAG